MLMNEANQKAIDDAESILKDMRVYFKRSSVKGQYDAQITVDTDFFILIAGSIKQLTQAVQDQAEHTKKYFELYSKEVAKDVIE